MSTVDKSLDSHPWIDAQLVQHLVNKSEGENNWNVKSFHNGSSVEDGQNFSSDTIRLVVDLQDRCDATKTLRKSYFFKICLKSPEFEGVLKENLNFEKEIEIYTKILPAVEELLESIGVPTQMGPKCFYTDMDRGVLVFEDLNVGQFVHVDKTKGFDKEHMTMCVKWMAKWHAATAVLLLKRPEMFEWNSKPMYINSKTIEGFFRNLGNGLSSVLRKWGGYDSIADKFVNIPQHAFDEVHKRYLPVENGFNVLTHADAWTNNILFRYNEQNALVDTRWVDFALCKHSQPTIDLAVLLYVNGDKNTTQADRERYIKFYHGELVELLRKMNYPKEVPTLLDIQVIAYRMDFYTAFAVLLCTGLRFLDTSFEGGSIEMSKSIDSGEQSGGMYSHPDCQRQLKYLLDLTDRRGYFDF